jgi:hypothetical protein
VRSGSIAIPTVASQCSSGSDANTALRPSTNHAQIGAQKGSQGATQLVRPVTSRRRSGGLLDQIARDRDPHVALDRDLDGSREQRLGGAGGFTVRIGRLASLSSSATQLGRNWCDL